LARDRLLQIPTSDPAHSVARSALRWLDVLLAPAKSVIENTVNITTQPTPGTYVEFRASCPACEAQLVVRASALGKPRRCPACLTLFEIPSSAANRLYLPGKSVAFVEPNQPVNTQALAAMATVATRPVSTDSSSIFEEAAPPQRAVSAAMSSVFLWKSVTAESPEQFQLLQQMAQTPSVAESPITKPSASEATRESPITINQPPSPVTPDGRRVLIVDDSAALRAVAGRLLTRRGYEVDAVESGESALRWIEEKTPQLILLDVVMPGLDGYEVCRRLRQHPLTQGVPVIMLSGRNGFLDKVQGRLAGCTVYMTKPCEAKVLCETVGNYLPLATTN